MHEVCELCNDCGALRDGSPCPRCSLSQWKDLHSHEAITRPKRTVWIRALDRDTPRGTAPPIRVIKS